MSARPTAPELRPLAGINDAGPVFVEQWHAQVLGVANVLVQTGVLKAEDWSNALGAALAARNASEDSSHQIYYESALEALEKLLGKSGAPTVDGQELKQRVEAWRAAYLATPHGEPVRLENAALPPHEH